MNNALEGIKKRKIIVICRRVYGETLIRLADALHKGGVDYMEVTFDQSDEACIEKTGGAISALNAAFAGEMEFGAGTVLNAAQVLAAKEAGAKYIISPNVNFDVIDRTLEYGLISIPGAMTPSEILSAYERGAQLVKLFPAGTLGLKYAKDIRGPISHVPLLATGGVNEENFGAFLQAGLAGAGISGRLTDKTCLAAGDFDELMRRAKVFAEIAEKANA